MTIDFSQIRVDLQEHDRWRRTLTFIVPPAVVRAERAVTATQLARRLKMPGFGKGKAPASAIERQHAQAIERETLERVIGEVYRKALEERGLQPITEAEIDVVEHEPEGPLTFKASFEIRPVIQLARLGGFRVTRPSARVDSDEVERVLERLVRENAIWRPPDDRGKAREGDLVTVQIVPLETVSGRGVGLPWARRLQLRSDTEHRGRYQFILGEGDAVADLESAVRTLSPGESGEFTVRDDAEVGSGRVETSTTPLRLRITLENRRVPELPALDNAFARSLGDFSDLESLRRKIREGLEAEASGRADSVLRERLLAQLMSANPFQAPASMVEQQRKVLSDNVLRPGRDRSEATGAERGAGRGDPRPELQEEAVSAVKRALLIASIAEAKGLAATERDVEERISEVAALGGVTPEEVQARLVRTHRLEALARDITERKVFGFLLSQSQVVDEA